ncbi:MAG: beta-aspartyl-peptidase [Sporomusaceae bacterium]|nr:beta-aspartyl-peptidase [Sporomusaceae bacterium]
MLFTVLKNCDVYAPQHLGHQDILIIGDKIAKIAPRLDLCTAVFPVEVIDVDGGKVVPGFIDPHVHMIGGGGEAGFYSRVPEIMLSGIVSAGITTLVGVLGTDGTTRHLESLLAKARGLETEGVTTYMFTGSYELPAKTITGSVRNDIIIVDKVIGVGEVAISDHRSSEPTVQELRRLATEARLGGMLSGKAGIAHFHMGSGKDGLTKITEAIHTSEIPARHFYPTHINRKRELLDEAMDFAKLGGYIDMTAGVSPQNGFAGTIKPSSAIINCLDNGVPLERITMSSDGNGSMAVYNESGQVDRLLVTTLDSIHKEFRDLVLADGLDLTRALHTVTTNTARLLGLLPLKGCIGIDSQADIIILDDQLNIRTVFAKGIKMIENGAVIRKGTFE